MMRHKVRIALAATLLALAAVSVVDSAWAAGGGIRHDKLVFGEEVLP
jgi:hypothetical protein